MADATVFNEWAAAMDEVADLVRPWAERDGMPVSEYLRRVAHRESMRERDVLPPAAGVNPLG